MSNIHEINVADENLFLELWQYDAGQKLKFVTTSIADGSHVLFANSETRKAIRKEVANNQVGIPNKFLRATGKMHITIETFNENEETTLYEINGYIKRRQDGEPGTSPEDEPTFIQKIIRKTIELAQSVRDDADNGVFNGEDGYSPQITVKTQTPSTYILNIKTEDDDFDTPNLQGQGGEGTLEAGDGLKREDNTMSVDIDANSILEFNNHKLSADTSGLQPTISGGNGIDVSSDVVSVDLKSSGSFLNFSSGKLGVDTYGLGVSRLRAYLSDTQELSQYGALATKNYVDNLVSGRLKRLVVESLPTQDIDTNTIYMILKTVPTTNNIYDEYMYINGAWELIGSTEVDLSNYYTKTESDNNYLPKYTIGSGLEVATNELKVKLSVLSGQTNYIQFNTFGDGGLWLNAYDLGYDTTLRSNLTSDSYSNPLQPLITTTSKLSADKVNDSNTTNKFVPTHSSTESGKVLGVDSNGDLEWTTKGGGSYSGGDGIDITNDTISVDLKSGSKLNFDNGELDVDLSSKEDKTTITTDTSSTTPTLTLADNNEYRYTQDLTSLTLTMPSGNFIASVVFSSGSTPTSMTYDSSIKWSGDDITNGQFVPSASKDYDIMFYYNGLNINGIVRGAS